MKNQRSKFIFCGYCILFFALLMAFESCASKPKFRGKANLCGLIVDEKNKPVSDVKVSLWRGGSCLQTSLTNENGIFVFYNLSSALYKISGEKRGYSYLDKVDYRFSDNAKIFCSQMFSMDAVFKEAEEKLLCGETKKMLEILDSLCVSKNDYDETALLFYRACGHYVRGELNAANKNLKKIKSRKKLINEEGRGELELMQSKLRKNKKRAMADNAVELACAAEAEEEVKDESEVL